ncbi:MAG: hypothetical protein N2053_05490 [Chitinispirillaceae bacterium]|nr:hypothetical protein [Chitinispirillaceae bacterium]
MKNKIRLLCIIALLFLTSEGFAAAAKSIRATKPTHYFYTPTAYINDEFDLVISFHEVSFVLPHKLQLHLSVVDNVGRICFGMRYGFFDNLSIGGGLAWSFATLSEGHAIHREFDPRLGVFLCWGFVKSAGFEAALTPNIQVGDHTSAGLDLGMKITPSDYWSVLGEVAISFDITDAMPYINTIWGTRIHPPQIPFLSFDVGIDVVERSPERFGRGRGAYGVFLDVIFTMKTK